MDAVAGDLPFGLPAAQRGGGPAGPPVAGLGTARSPPRSARTSTGLAACHSPGGCSALAGQLLDNVRGYAPFQALYWTGLYLLYVVPALVGTFWGAPLIAREIEAGTLRMAWTQSVSRTRWLAANLGVGALASMAAPGLLSLMVSWWASRVDPLDPFGMNRLQPAMFGARGIAPAGYAVFAFVLGVTAGLLIRNTVAAMAVYSAAEALVIVWIRPPASSPGARHHAAQRVRSGVPGTRTTGLRGGRPGTVLPRHDRQAAPPADRDLPAGQPVLAAAVGGDVALPGPGPGPVAGRFLLRVDPAAADRLSIRRVISPVGQQATI